MLAELAQRGHRVRGADYDGWVLPDGAWDEPRIRSFLDAVDSVIVSGTVENLGRFSSAFLDARLPVVALADAVEQLLQLGSMPTWPLPVSPRERCTSCRPTFATR